MIGWIAERENTEPQGLAELLAPKKVEQFLAGVVNKSIAEKLARLANIPFGYLFLSQPPVINNPQIPDLRQTVGAEPLSKDFIDVLKDIERKVDWYKEFLLENGDDTPREFVNKFPYSTTPNYIDVAQDIAKTIDFFIERDLPNTSRENYYRKLSARFEKIGILIFKNGVVGNNNKRKLNVEEFRGFALIDNLVPAIFINNADHPSAQLFTLLHEVAHIWIGQNGVSSWNQDRAVEAFCNKVAAEFLMPEALFLAKWAESDENHAEYVANYFKVSQLATVVKAVQLNLLPQEAIEQARKQLKAAPQETNTGGHFYNMFPVKNSHRFTDAVVNQAMSLNLPLREAGKLLNVHADTVVGYYRHKRKELWNAS
ncbi:Zn peptidase [Pasteurellaceae bacterium RH1A]|nr:Zn peptidase [Pasteurellaceae bacterium RH1A]